MVRIAQVGVGYWGPNLLRNLSSNYESTVKAVVDPSKERQEFVKKTYPGIYVTDELDSVITRLGDNSRIIFAGDFRQTDFRSDFEKNGILDFKSILSYMSVFDVIEFGIDDIVRSALVKDYIITKYELGYA